MMSLSFTCGSCKLTFTTFNSLQNHVCYMSYNGAQTEQLKNVVNLPSTTLQGVKADEGKEPMDLIAPEAIFQMTKVLQFGAKKYGRWNWSKGITYTRILAAIMRHLLKYMSGESIDPETGLSHIAAVMCNCMFLLHFEKFRPDLDDREKEAFKKS